MTARAEWKLAGRWSQFRSMTSPPGDEFAFLVGVAAHMQSGDPDTGGSPNTSDPNDWYIFTADASLMYGGATLFGSFTYSSMDSASAFVQGSNNFFPPTTADIGSSHAWGAVLQGSYYFDPKWEVFARAEFGEANISNINQITAPTGVPSLEQGNLCFVSGRLHGRRRAKEAPRALDVSLLERESDEREVWKDGLDRAESAVGVQGALEEASRVLEVPLGELHPSAE